ncbi:MAG: class I SAM-dependent methyltransferase [Steroidobacteraceae bacterium]|nr:class I SAM-dependent methyltransferase [Nevskiaceae bacterium]MCP5360891.1 class I SAM-dependent methyltransferase [Nevskiaceae bacterium]MCP5466274.1 class I SAM-dependent methyltransferase [Nevskiaceae bacterium]MCP5471676.1 class I SAM-dependent methyltransferase [Nevskiaceae bacterium]
MSQSTLSLTPPLHRYLLEHSLREPAILARLRAVTAGLPMANMQIAPEQGQFLQLLVRILGARRCLEIGTFTGYSSLAVALALPGDGRLIACDVSAEWTQIARQFWREAGVDGRIDLRLQPALRTLDELLLEGQASAFDFAFIDADKANYCAYYEKVLDLLRPGGLICVDNVLWGGAVADPLINNDANTQALRAFNELVHRDERVDLSLLPIGDGLTVMRKRG